MLLARAAAFLCLLAAAAAVEVSHVSENGEPWNASLAKVRMVESAGRRKLHTSSLQCFSTSSCTASGMSCASGNVCARDPYGVACGSTSYSYACEQITAGTSATVTCYTSTTCNSQCSSANSCVYDAYGFACAGYSTANYVCEQTQFGGNPGPVPVPVPTPNHTPSQSPSNAYICPVGYPVQCAGNWCCQSGQSCGSPGLCNTGTTTKSNTGAIAAGVIVPCVCVFFISYFIRRACRNRSPTQPAVVMAPMAGQPQMVMVQQQPQVMMMPQQSPMMIVPQTAVTMPQEPSKLPPPSV